VNVDTEVFKEKKLVCLEVRTLKVVWTFVKNCGLSH